MFQQVLSTILGGQILLSQSKLCIICSGEDACDTVRLQVHRDVAGDQPQRGRAARRDAGADRAQGGGRREGAALQGRHSFSAVAK